MSRSSFVTTLTLLFTLLFVTAAPGPTVVRSASHREAPLIALDAEADITDFFMFRSYEAGNEDKIVFIMDVIPGEEPSSGPNYWYFDPNVLYEFSIDNDGDGEAEDIKIQFRFRNEFRGVNKDLGLFLSYVALPPITALDGAGSEGLGLRQKYSVALVRDGNRTKLADDLIAVPSNVGPRTMPDYEALAAQGIYDLGDGVRVFAGQRDDPFYIDLGAIFDTLNLRSPGVDMLSGFNVHTIAIEVPATWITADGLGPDETAHPLIGAYASTSRRRVTVLRPRPSHSKGASIAEESLESEGVDVGSLEAESLDYGRLDYEGLANGNVDNPANGQQGATYEHYLPLLAGPDKQAATEQSRVAQASAPEATAADAGPRKLISTQGDFIQVQRLANPLVNEAIIGTVDKDRWNALDPNQESRFLDYYLNPRLALALQVVFGVPAATTNRTDLVDLLLKYSPDDDELSELLRLNISVQPTSLDQQQRLTVLAGDNAGWPNGRRPIDDVTDVAIQVVGGPNFAGAGDGVDANDLPLPASFPFLSTPWDGRNRVHENP
ncbi:MAG TPA: DUF4331 domain-containing protein [Caldilineaceae bacterium]|nr:DUF4331 domain-containing protein [Caldilineaceae bacterium]